MCFRISLGDFLTFLVKGFQVQDGGRFEMYGLRLTQNKHF